MRRRPTRFQTWTPSAWTELDSWRMTWKSAGPPNSTDGGKPVQPVQATSWKRGWLQCQSIRAGAEPQTHRLEPWTTEGYSQAWKPNIVCLGRWIKLSYALNSNGGDRQIITLFRWNDSAKMRATQNLKQLLKWPFIVKICYKWHSLKCFLLIILQGIIENPPAFNSLLHF